MESFTMRFVAIFFLALSAGCDVDSGESQKTETFSDGYQFGRDGLVVGSWHLNPESGRIDADLIAEVLVTMDVSILQGVKSMESVRAIRRSAERFSGDRWEFVVSPRTEQGYHAYLHRRVAAAYAGGAAAYPDPKVQFPYAPFSARFSVQGVNFEFVAASAFILEQSEVSVSSQIQALGMYWDWLKSSYGNTNIFLTENSGVRVTKPDWGHLTSAGAQSVAESEGKLSRLWSDSTSILNARARKVIDVSDELGVPREVVRQKVSDSDPVVFAIRG